MSEQIKDGGPAFPCAGHESGMDFDRGMSIRDYFAAAALQGLVQRYTNRNIAKPMIARMAYTIADAMLAERSK